MTEFLDKQTFFFFFFLLRLNAHVSPSGTACYITSNMFYIEVQLEKDGNVIDVKLAHFGEAPVVKLIVSHLLVVSYLASSCHAFGFLLVLSHACQPGHDTIYLFRHLNLLPKLPTRLQIISIIELNIKVKLRWHAHFQEFCSTLHKYLYSHTLTLSMYSK